jgi:AraC-like DNA-binding protein
VTALPEDSLPAGLADALAGVARAAAAPAALHHHTDGDVEERIAGAGGCAACRLASETAAGLRACVNSRRAPARQALRRGRPVPFVCHLGFACVAAPVDRNRGLTLTVGPYCPEEAPHSLPDDVDRGLRRVVADWAGDVEDLLDDIRIVPASAVPEITAWGAERLAALWTPPSPPEPAQQVTEDPAAQTGARRRASSAPDDPHSASVLAAALAGGQAGRAREILQNVLAQNPGTAKTSGGVRRARAAAVAGAVLEAAERAGFAAAPLWDGFAAFLETVRSARSENAVADATLAFLSRLKRREARAALTDASMEDLNRILEEGLADGITLADVAARLGQHPTAITHRLQRKFGMSFSEYAGRMRVDKSKTLLRRTKLAVSEVATRVGINDVSNFTRLFRKFEHMTPAEYRKRLER